MRPRRYFCHVFLSPLKITCIRPTKQPHTHTRVVENALAISLRTPLIRNYFHGLDFVCCALRQVVPAAKQTSDHKYHSEHPAYFQTCTRAARNITFFLSVPSHRQRKNKNHPSSVKCVMNNNNNNQNTL